MSSSAITGPIFTDVRRSPSGSAAAPSWSFNDSQGTGFYLVSADVLGLSTAGVQRVVVDASGNVGIGTASPANYGTANTTTLTAFRADQNITIGAYWQAGVGQYSFINSGTTNNATAVALAFQTGGTERMRLDSSGNLTVGVTSTGGARVRISKSSSDGVWMLQGITDGTEQLRINNQGSIQNSLSSYGGLSDAKLKENVVDATPKLEKLKQVRIVNFNLIDDQTKQIGVIAQELEQIFPSMVESTADKDSEGKDLGTVTKSVKYSVFVPMLIKAMQEQQEIIGKLEARLAALESK